MTEILINTLNCKSKKDLHLILKTAFKLPEYYGNNLDALYDCLTTDIILPDLVIWINFNECKEYLGSYPDEVLDIILKASEFFNKNLKIQIN